MRKREKLGLVVGLSPTDYKVKDPRLNKPVCHQKVKNGQVIGPMLLQDIDIARIDAGKSITYFCPNNIAILLSASSKALMQAKQLYKDVLNNPAVIVELEKAKENRTVFLNQISSKVCDYIELIQIALVFGYTALETFANLSIPDDYTYKTTSKSKGIEEAYDKTAIERWLSLKIKFQDILRDIYQTKKLESQKWWIYFTDLEKYRNQIIHQKSINSTEFYKPYFNSQIFAICEVPLSVIKCFYEQHAEKNRTNPIWPWLVQGKNYFPVSTEFESEHFEVIGNLYEGMNK